MSSSKDSFLLHSFLFHLRTPLASIKGASQAARNMPDIQVDVISWLEKWLPSIEGWIVAEEKAHLLLRDEQEHDWEQIVYEMAKNMKDVSFAYAEGASLDLPESPNGKMIFNLTLGGGFRYLNEIIQPILNKDFQHVLNR